MGAGREAIIKEGFVGQLSTQPVNQEVYAYAHQNDGINNTEGNKPTSVSDNGVNNDDQHRKQKEACKETFQTGFPHIPTLHTKDILADIKSILGGLSSKCKYRG